jgi:hypothetical protein
VMQAVTRGSVRAVAVAVVLVLASSACAREGTDAELTLGVPGRANANVSLAAAGDFVAAVWSAAEPGGSMDIYLSTTLEGGRSF